MFVKGTIAKNDLQGGKCLTPDRLIEWPYFLDMQGSAAALPSNLIDTQVNQVVFDLPESTIPDDIVLVSNLPFRNLVRSSSIGLCAGEDVAELYRTKYPVVEPLKDHEVEPDPHYRDVFKIDTKGKFRTPLWYYLLREAEAARSKAGHKQGHLGPLGSHLVAEVILSGIWYATPSFLQSGGWQAQIPVTSGDPRQVKLIDIANYVNGQNASAPACEQPGACSAA